MTVDKQGRPYARLSDLKEGMWLELDMDFTCIDGRRVQAKFDDEWWVPCKEGRHYLAPNVDNEGYIIGVYHVANEIITLENETMIREWGTKLVNTLVEASDLARRVTALQVELEKITNALTVANEAAAKAIAERDAAFAARDRANELREQAEHAYHTVNEGRVSAERELADARDTLRVNKALLDDTSRKLEDATAEVALWKEEAGKLAATGDEVAAKLRADIFAATSNAAAMVDAVRAEKEAVISALRLEVQALKDGRGDLQRELGVSEADVRTLRKIISEAKLATQGTMGVLNGEMAAE